MVHDTRNFLLGGLSSFLLSALFIFSFIYLITQENIIKKIDMQKNQFVSVDISKIKVPTPKKKQATKGADKKTPKVKEVKKEVKNPDKITKRVIDADVKKKSLSSLFGKIKTKELTKTTNKQSTKAQSKSFEHIGKSLDSKKLEKSDSTSASSIIKNLHKEKKLIKPIGDSVGVQDKYLGKIQEIIYRNFFPLTDSVGKKATIIIYLDKFGNITRTRIKGNISDPQLREAVENCLRGLKSADMPKNPEKRKLKFEIDLIVEGN